MILEGKHREHGRHCRQGFAGSEFQLAAKELGCLFTNGFGPTVFLESCACLSYRPNDIVSMAVTILHVE